MNAIHLVPAEGVETVVLDVMERCVSRTFGLPARRTEPFREPPDAYDARRDQYSSTVILQLLAGRLETGALRVLAVTQRDVFIPMLSFIFGQAQLGGRLALVSLARLQQEFYGLPPDRELTLERACKEAIHELGHTFGLTHCKDSRCAMSLSVSIDQVDTKSSTFCRSCRVRLREAIAASGPAPGEEES